MKLRTGLKVLLVAALAAVPVGAAGCGDEADNAVDEVTSAIDEGIDTVTSEADDAIDSATTDDSTDTAASGAQVVEVPAAEQGLAYAETSVTAPAGTITLRMPNPSTIPHNIAIEEPETVTGEVVNQDGVSEVTADFAAGSYEFFCTVPGHRDAGMVGTLTVE
jgi:uncharacterized cupredoxin-like copper-binding protein